MEEKILHVYGQYAYHTDLIIIGNEEGLGALKMVIELALAHGQGNGEVSCNDGEGYTVIVVKVESDKELPVPYIAEWATDFSSKIPEDFVRREKLD